MLKKGLLVILGVLSMAASGAAQATKEETELFSLPASCIKDSLTVSEDGSRWAWIENTSGGQSVISSGLPGKTYRQCAGLQFSPVTNRLFYWGNESNQTIMLVLGTDEIPTSMRTEGSLKFSADGSRWAYMGADWNAYGRGKDFTICNNVVSLDFSPDGKHVAYLEMKAAGQVALLVDGIQTKSFEKPKEACSLSYLGPASIGWRPYHYFKLHYMLNGELLLLTQGEDGWLLFAGETVLARYPRNEARTQTGGTVMLFPRQDSSAECEARSAVFANSVVTAAKAPVAAWCERLPGEEGLWRITKNGKPVDGITFEGWETRICLSSNGLHCAYAITRKAMDSDSSEHFVVAGDKRYGPYDWVSAPVLSDDGKHVAFIVRINQKPSTYELVMDGKASAKQFNSISKLLYLENGSSLAWIATRDKQAIVGINEEEVGSGDEVLTRPRLDRTGISWVLRRGDKVIRQSLAISGRAPTSPTVIPAKKSQTKPANPAAKM